MDHEQAMEKAAPGTPGGDNCHVLHVVQQAERELHELTEQRAGIAKRILSVKQTIIGLADLFGDDILDTALLDLFDRKGTSRRPGITLACRRLLMEAEQPMSAATFAMEFRGPRLHCWPTTNIPWQPSTRSW